MSGMKITWTIGILALLLMVPSVTSKDISATMGPYQVSFTYNKETYEDLHTELYNGNGDLGLDIYHPDATNGWADGNYGLNILNGDNPVAVVVVYRGTNSTDEDEIASYSVSAENEYYDGLIGTHETKKINNRDWIVFNGKVCSTCGATNEAVALIGPREEFQITSKNGNLFTDMLNSINIEKIG